MSKKNNGDLEGCEDGLDLGTFGKPSKRPRTTGFMMPPKDRAKHFETPYDAPGSLVNDLMQADLDKFYVPSVNSKKRCHHSHPLLPIEVKGKVFYVSGGSCLIPPDNSVDVFIGFDAGMLRTTRRYPWIDGEEVHYLIPDMGVPPTIGHFKHLIQFITEQVYKDKSVHMGCIGGHGRTGLVLSVLVKQMMGITDSITYVREHYCKKAVESSVQVDWLYKHFGIKKVKGAKEFGNSDGWTKSLLVSKPSKKSPKKVNKVQPIADDGGRVVPCVPVCTSIHGKNTVINKKV